MVTNLPMKYLVPAVPLLATNPAITVTALEPTESPDEGVTKENCVPLESKLWYCNWAGKFTVT